MTNLKFMIDRVQKTIVFTKTPLTKYFRYKDKFQIYPADLDGMPKSGLQEHYPVILEYIIEDDEVIIPIREHDGLQDLQTLTASTLTKQDEILNLLTLFTNHIFFRYYDLTGTWGMQILKENPKKEEANEWSSKWNMKMFHWPGLPQQLKIQQFKELELKYEPVEFVPFREYYQKNPNYDYYSNSLITFPNIIFLGLDAYYLLDTEVKKIIDMAISHHVSSIELRQFKKTLSVISAFTAIETMVNYENKDFKPSNCKECGQPIYSVSKKYRDYLAKYIGNNDNNKKKFTALYSLRSKIVHTGLKFSSENLFNNLTDETRHEEFISQMEVILLSKLSIVYWLVMNNKENDIM